MSGPNLNNLESRRHAQGLHPINRVGAFTLDWATMRSVAGLINDWILLGKSGLTFEGGSRFGKSHTAKHVEKTLARSYPEIVFMYVSAELDPNRHGSGERMCSQFLSFMLNEPELKKIDQAVSILTNHMMSELVSQGGTTLVLLLDEAQKLSLVHWNALAIVWNRLERHGYRMLVYSFGNSALKARSSVMENSGYELIAGRFFVRSFDFDGINSHDELEHLLGQFDETLFHPSPAWPYSRFFAADAYDGQGWRLKHEAPLLWEALASKCGHKLESGRGVGIQWIIDPVKFRLRSLLEDTTGSEVNATVDTWKTAIEYCDPLSLFSPGAEMIR